MHELYHVDQNGRLVFSSSHSWVLSKVSPNVNIIKGFFCVHFLSDWCSSSYRILQNIGEYCWPIAEPYFSWSSLSFHESFSLFCFQCSEGLLMNPIIVTILMISTIIIHIPSPPKSPRTDPKLGLSRKKATQLSCTSFSDISSPFHDTFHTFSHDETCWFSWNSNHERLWSGFLFHSWKIVKKMVFWTPYIPRY